MAASVPPLTVLRDALVSRLQAIKRSAGPLTPVDQPRLDALIATVKTTPPTATSLAAAATMTPSAMCGLKPLAPLSSSNPLDYACFQFGQGNLGWHFCYGNLGLMAFSLMFFRVELSTPRILREMKIPPEAGVIYTISAGFGPKGGPWTTMPATAVQGIYTCGHQSYTFKALPGADCPWLESFTLTQDQGLTQVALQWVPPTTDGNTNGSVGYQVTLTPSKAPVFQGPKGCMPCSGGLGTLYWSYPLMSAQGSVGPLSSPTVGSGAGWYDHQWMAIGGALNVKTLQLLNNIVGMFRAPAVVRWLWLTLQLPNDLQYMLSVLLNGLPVVGATYNFSVVTKVQGTTADYGVKGTVTVEAVAQLGEQSYPTKYSITLEGVTYTLQAAFGLSGVYLPSGVLNWEGPGDVFDAAGNHIGGGFLEANQLDTSDNLIATAGMRAGVPASQFPLFRLKRTSICAGILSILILLLVLALVILVLVWGAQSLWHVVKR